MTARLAIPGEIVLWCAWLLTLLLIAAGAMISFGRSCWACELLSHFPAQLAAAALVTSVAFAVVGRLRYIVIPAAVAAWNIGALVPFYASVRSEERRVGKECSGRGGLCRYENEGKSMSVSRSY